MKLYIHDEKHEQVYAYLNLGDLTPKEVELLDHVLVFLDREGITNRYKRLVIAQGYEQLYVEGEPSIKFNYEGVGE